MQKFLAIKYMLLLLTLIRFSFCGTSEETGPKQDGKFQEFSENYLIEVKDLKTSKTFKGFLEVIGAGEYTTEIAVRIKFFYEQKLFSGGEVYNFTIYDREKTQVTENQRSNFNVVVSSKIFQKNSIFSSKEKSEAPSVVEFNITDGGELWITDLKNGLTVKGQNFDLEIISWKDYGGNTWSILAVCFFGVILIGNCYLFLVMIDRPIDDTKRRKISLSIYGSSSFISVIIAGLRILIEFPYMVTVWILVLNCLFIFGGSLLYVPKHIKYYNDTQELGIKYDHNLKNKIIGAYVLIGVIFCFFPQFFPFLLVLVMLAIQFDNYYFSEDPEESIVSYFAFLGIFFIGIPFEFYVDRTLVYNPKTEGHFWIWFGVTVVIFLGSFVISCFQKKHEYPYRDWNYIAEKRRKIKNDQNQGTNIENIVQGNRSDPPPAFNQRPMLSRFDFMPQRGIDSENRPFEIKEVGDRNNNMNRDIWDSKKEEENKESWRFAKGESRYENEGYGRGDTVLGISPPIVINVSPNGGRKGNLEIFEIDVERENSLYNIRME